MVYWGTSGSRNKENKKHGQTHLIVPCFLSSSRRISLRIPLAGVCFLIRNLPVLQAPLPKIMEYRGVEPLASTMRMLRAPNCANTPSKIISHRLCYYSTLFSKMKEQITNFCEKLFLFDTVQLFLIKVALHFGHFTSIFPFPRGIRIFCLQSGHL